MKPETPPPAKFSISLSAAATGISTLVTSAAMFVYGMAQYYQNPELGVMELAAHHLWHVVVLAVLTWALTHLALYFLVVRPIARICVKLYTISRGARNPREPESPLREIRKLVHGLDWLEAQLRNSQSRWQAGADLWADRIRAIAGELKDDQARSRRALVELADELEFGRIFRLQDYNPSLAEANPDSPPKTRKETRSQ